MGQDLMRVSLPVCLNEPLGGIQRLCDMFHEGIEQLKRAAVHPDPVWRLALGVIGNTALFSSVKFRKKKPFNAMLGETFEMVGKDFRFVGEKVAHSPDQINAYVFEGENFI